MFYQTDNNFLFFFCRLQLSLVMITFKALILELLLLANYYWYQTQSETVVFRIGALLSSRSVLQEFERNANVTIDFDNNTKIQFEPFSEVSAIWKFQ